MQGFENHETCLRYGCLEPSLEYSILFINSYGFFVEISNLNILIYLLCLIHTHFVSPHPFQCAVASV